MLKLLFRLILLGVVVLILGFLFAPNIVSTTWGKTVFFKIYKTVAGKTLTADKFNVSWWKGQRLENVTLANPQEKRMFEANEIITDASLWQILFYHNLGNMHITAPTVVFNPEIPLPEKPKITQAGFLPAIHLSHIPLPSLPPYLGHVTVSDGKAQFLSPGLDPIELQAVDLDVTLLKAQIKAKGNGETSQGSIQGKFDLALMYMVPQAQIDLTANLQNFPVRSLDQIIAIKYPSLQGALIEAIGAALNVQLRLRNHPDALELHCEASSPSFTASIETATHDGIVTLAAPALVQFQIPAPFFQKITSVAIQKPFLGLLKIDNLSLPLDDKESFSFQATLKGDAVQFPFGLVQPFALFASTANFKERNFTLKIDSPQIQLNTTLFLPNAWEQLTLSGQALLTGNTRIDLNAQTLSAVSATVQGDQWQGAFFGTYDPRGNAILFTKPAKITYRLASLPAPLPPLKEPLPLYFEIDPFKLSLPDLSGPISARISAEPFALGNTSVGASQIAAKGDLKSRKGTFDLKSTLDQGMVTASGTVSWPDDFTLKASLTKVPTSFIDLFFNTRQQLTPIIGTLINGQLDLAASSNEKKLSLQLATDLLTAQASLEQTGDFVQLTKPAQLTLKLTPEGYLALDRWLNPTASPFALSQALTVKSSIASLRWPLAEKKDLNQISYNASLSIDTLAFAGKNGSKSTQLNNVQIQLEHASPSAPLSFSVAASGVPEGSVALQGKIDPAAGATQINCTLAQFPTEALDVVARAVGQGSFSVATLLGPQVNLAANASLENWSGPIKLQLNSPNIRSSLNGTLTAGLLTLNDTFHMQMSLNPDVSGMILKLLNPLSVNSLTSEGPITLEIPPSGFTYPVFPFAPDKINIPSGRLELGKIYSHNEGNLNIALGLLKLSQFSQNQSLELWFAPLDFHIKKGQLDCERTEILVASAYQICTWGNVDFVDRQVDMILGLTADCLRKAFGIKNLPDNYVLQIPMRGPLNDVKINSSKATTKIAALLLWQQKGSAIGGGTAGAVLGGLMNKIGPLPDGSSKAPPAKQPFPWELNAPAKKKKISEAEAVPAKKKKLVHPDEQALKQALKLLR